MMSSDRLFFFGVKVIIYILNESVLIEKTINVIVSDKAIIINVGGNTVLKTINGYEMKKNIEDEFYK